MWVNCLFGAAACFYILNAASYYMMFVVVSPTLNRESFPAGPLVVCLAWIVSYTLLPVVSPTIEKGEGYLSLVYVLIYMLILAALIIYFNFGASGQPKLDAPYSWSWLTISSAVILIALFITSIWVGVDTVAWNHHGESLVPTLWSAIGVVATVVATIIISIGEIHSLRQKTK